MFDNAPQLSTHTHTLSLSHPFTLLYFTLHNNTGDRMYAELWSARRFDNVDTYLKYQKKHSKIKGDYYEELVGLHSEDFMRFLFEEVYNNIVPLTIKDICVQRVRSNGLIRTDDCDLLSNATYTTMTTRLSPQHQK
jgi:hypothetical protein